MKRSGLMVAVLVLVAATGLFPVTAREGLAEDKGASVPRVFTLPPPETDGTVSVEKALSRRRTVRTYREAPLSLGEVSQLLWAAQGITEPTRGLRTAPSPKALYLLNTYVIAGGVSGLPAGMYKYEPGDHSLRGVREGDVKAVVYKAVGQASIKSAPALVVFTGSSERTPKAALMYLEAGAAAQNIHLQAVTLGLGTVTVAGFTEESVKDALKLAPREVPIYIMPVGKR